MEYNVEIFWVEEMYRPLLRTAFGVLFSILVIKGVKLIESIELAGITFVIGTKAPLAGCLTLTVAACE